jgi:hypothetical protein
MDETGMRLVSDMVLDASKFVRRLREEAEQQAEREEAMMGDTRRMPQEGDVIEMRIPGTLEWRRVTVTKLGALGHVSLAADPDWRWPRDTTPLPG